MISRELKWAGFRTKKHEIVKPPDSVIKTKEVPVKSIFTGNLHFFYKENKDTGLINLIGRYDKPLIFHIRIRFTAPDDSAYDQPIVVILETVGYSENEILKQHEVEYHKGTDEQRFEGWYYGHPALNSGTSAPDIINPDRFYSRFTHRTTLDSLSAEKYFDFVERGCHVPFYGSQSHADDNVFESNGTSGTDQQP